MLRAGARQTFAAFSVGRYRLHWTQTVAAFIAFSMSFTVQSVVAFDLTGANAAVGLVGAGNGIAWLVLSRALWIGCKLYTIKSTATFIA